MALILIHIRYRYFQQRSSIVNHRQMDRGIDRFIQSTWRNVISNFCVTYKITFLCCEGYKHTLFKNNQSTI